MFLGISDTATDEPRAEVFVRLTDRRLLAFAAADDEVQGFGKLALCCSEDKFKSCKMETPDGWTRATGRAGERRCLRKHFCFGKSVT